MNNKQFYFRFWTLSLIFSVLFLSSLAAKTSSFTKLSGTPIGTDSWSGTAQDDKVNAFDGDFNTFFDSGANGWVGLDLGTAKVVTLVKYSPRAAIYAFRFVNAIVQGANNADFSDAVTLLTIQTEPLENILTGASLNNTVAYRYVRLKAATDACSVSELEFDEGSIDADKLSGTAIGTDSWSGTAQDDKVNAFDGDFNTFFDSANGWVGLDFGIAKVVTLVKYAPRAAIYAFRIKNAIIQGSNIADFSDAVDLLTIPSEPLENILTAAFLNNTVAYRYIRLLPKEDACSISELEFYGGSSEISTKINSLSSRFNIYQSGSSIVVDLTALIGQQTLTIFDLQGKSLLTHLADGGDKFTISNDLKKGVYLIKVQGSEKDVMTKLIIR